MSGIRDPRVFPGDTVNLPIRPFLYTLDQIATLLSLDVHALKVSGHIHWDDRSTGGKYRNQMLARNIAPPDEKPDWRVSERELIRWLRVRKFKIHEPSWVEDF